MNSNFEGIESDTSPEGTAQRPIGTVILNRDSNMGIHSNFSGHKATDSPLAQSITIPSASITRKELSPSPLAVDRRDDKTAKGRPTKSQLSRRMGPIVGKGSAAKSRASDADHTAFVDVLSDSKLEAGASCARRPASEDEGPQNV